MSDEVYFVMLSTQGGCITPMTGDDGEMALFGSKSEARQCAKDNLLGAHFGYQIFTDGEGDD